MIPGCDLLLTVLLSLNSSVPRSAAIGVERIDSTVLPEEVLQPTDAISLFPDGVVLLADQPTQLLVCIDPKTGKATCRLGAKGSGPGEFRGINYSHVDPTGRIAVLDVALRRLTVYGADRTLETSVNLTGLPGRILQFSGDSLSIDILAGLTPEIVRVKLTAQTSRTVSKPLELDPALAVNSPGGPPSPFLGFAGQPTGRILAFSPWRYRIVALDGAKVRPWAERPEVKPVVLTREQIAERKQQYQQMMDRVGKTGMMPKIDDTPQPFLQSFGSAVDGANRLWVITGRGTPTSTVVDVFAESGAFVGTVNFPYSFATFAIRGSDIAFVAISPSAPDAAALLYRYRIVTR
jgi:hypothetical protein